MKNLHNDPVSAFLRAVMTLSRRIRAERPAGALSLSGLGILGSLYRHGPLVATQLAAEERLAPQSLTRLLADLEEGGLIERTRSDVDRREITIAITPKGRQVLMDDMSARRSWLAANLKAALTPEERDAIFAASAAMLKLGTHE